MAEGNSIAKANVLITTNADPLNKGLRAAGDGASKWGATIGGKLQSALNPKGGLGLQSIGAGVSATLAGLAGKASALASGAGAAIGTAIGGPIGGAIGTAVGGAVGAVGETVLGAISAPFERLDKIREQVKAATALGIDPSQYQGLSVVLGKAGIEGGRVNQVLAEMTAKVHDVAEGFGRGAGRAFNDLGLDAQKLIKLKPDEQFLAIADAMAKLPPGGAQAAAATHLFGGAAADLLPELQKGSAGIKEFIGRMKASGAVLGTDQLLAAAGAAKAWKDARNEINGAWEGLKNRATLIATPVISFAAKAATRVFSLLTPVFDWVGRAVSKVADITTAVFEQILKWVDEGVALVKEWGAEIGAFAGEWPTVGEVIVMVFRGVGVAGSYVWDTFRAGAGLGAIAIGKVIEYTGKLADEFKGALKDIAGAGKSAAEALGLDETAEKFGKIEAAADTIGNKIEASGAAMGKWGQSAVDGFGTSAAKFNKWLDEALKKKTQAEQKAVSDAVTDLSGPAKFSGAIMAKSTEAYSMVLKNQFADLMHDDTPKKQLKAQKDGNKKLDDGNKKLDKINDNLEGVKTF